MRSTLTLTLILLVSAWAVAQQDMQRPGAPAGQSPSQTQSQPGTAPDQAAPGAPSAMPMAGSDMIEGCLGGTNPNYTVTDKAGTTYQLDIPKGADASVLSKHIGESVQVQGTKSGSSDAHAAGSASTTGSAAGAHSIRVARIGRGASACPGSGSSTATPKPPSK